MKDVIAAVDALRGGEAHRPGCRFGGLAFGGDLFGTPTPDTLAVFGAESQASVLSKWLSRTGPEYKVGGHSDTNVRLTPGGTHRSLRATAATRTYAQATASTAKTDADDNDDYADLHARNNVKGRVDKSADALSGRGAMMTDDDDDDRAEAPALPIFASLMLGGLLAGRGWWLRRRAQNGIMSRGFHPLSPAPGFDWRGRFSFESFRGGCYGPHGSPVVSTLRGRELHPPRRGWQRGPGRAAGYGFRVVPFLSPWVAPAFCTCAVLGVCAAGDFLAAFP